MKGACCISEDFCEKVSEKRRFHSHRVENAENLAAFTRTTPIHFPRRTTLAWQSGSGPRNRNLLYKKSMPAWGRPRLGRAPAHETPRRTASVGTLAPASASASRRLLFISKTPNRKTRYTRSFYIKSKMSLYKNNDRTLVGRQKWCLIRYTL